VLRDDASCRACVLLGHGLNASEQASAALWYALGHHRHPSFRAL
jgi:hypothetical protein